MSETTGKIWAVLFMWAVCVGVSAQTCRDDIQATAPDSRFTDNGDGTVTDAVMGLMWKQCTEGLSGTGCASGSAAILNWKEALEAADAADFAGHTDWRLPNKNELESLVERRCFDPAINVTYFPTAAMSVVFWSSSRHANTYADAWEVEFFSGQTDHAAMALTRYVRLVRVGQ